MEFKEGNMVDVWRRKDLVFGSWWTAKIISKYGHTYCVRYEKLVNSDGDRVVDAVNYEELRPLCTHTLGHCKNLMAGDMVEISDPLCWRIGEIVQILSRDWCLVKFGSLDKGTQIHKMNIHIQQVWDGNKWASVGKGGVIKDSDERVVQTDETCSWRLDFRLRKCLMNEEGTGDNFLKGSVNCSRNSKRIASHLPESCLDEASIRTFRKRKKRNPTEKLGACEGPLSSMLPQLPNKVGAVSFLETPLGENGLHTSTRGETFRSYITDIAREDLNGHISSNCIRHVNVTEETTHSSVASCSSNNAPFYTYNNSRTPIRVPIEKNNDDDTGSSCESRSGNILKLSQEEIAVHIHAMDLLAYHSTLRAFYASGSLSWEREAILTDLRLSLNISNDEHLLQLRNL